MSADPIGSSSAKVMLVEFEAQATITRKFLEGLPDEKLTWKPHVRSLSLGQLALHIAAVPGAIVRFVETNPVQYPGPTPFPQPANSSEILIKFNETISIVRSSLPKFDDSAMSEIWRILAGNQELVAMPRGSFLRDVAFSHYYQHRGQLSVYLRLLDLSVPASFGPSADDPPPALQNG